MPTRSRSSIARRRAAAFVKPRWIRRLSPIWRPTRWTGFREDIGSWKTIATSRPRMRFNSLTGMPMISRPSRRIDPETKAGGTGSSPMTASIDTLLPEPDSPTRAKVSLGATVRLTPLTARIVSVGRSKRTARFSMSSRFAPAAVVSRDGLRGPTAVAVVIRSTPRGRASATDQLPAGCPAVAGAVRAPGPT